MESPELAARVSEKCCTQALQDAANQLSSLVQKGLPERQHYKRKLLTAALRRDVWALRAAQPSFGVSDIPMDLRLFRQFDAVLMECLDDVLRRTDQTAVNVPLNKVTGPWEGGRLAEHGKATSSNRTQAKLVAWNGQGAFGRFADAGLNFDRMISVAAKLLEQQVTVAVISEPKLGEHVRWPADMEYQFLGARTEDPGSVAILVHNSIVDQVLEIPNLGTEKAIWVRIGCNPGLLLLAVYGPHAGTKMHIRETFWESRFSELQVLRQKPEFANCKLICLGDFNLHFPVLGAANTRMATRLDKRLQELFTSMAGFDCLLFNPTDVATHASGSIIDVVAATPALNPMVSVEWCDEGLLRSDHAFIKVALPDEPFTVSVEPERGEARWGTGAEWEQALESVNHALAFIAGWAATILTNAEILSWVQKGCKKGARLYLLNKACWWRSVVVTLAGHFSGIVVLAGPKAQNRDLFSEIQKHLDINWDEEDALFDDNETLCDMQASLHKDRVAKYMRLSQCDKQAAQSFLTKLLKPKIPIRTGFFNPSTGERLGEYETMLHLARDVETRSLAANSGNPGFNSWIAKHCNTLRKLAMKSCDVEPTFFIDFEELLGLIKGMTLNRASVHFPRRLFSASSTEGHILTWTLVNLFFNMGLLPSSWFRIISPVRKRGPAIVTHTANIRPISYVSDLEGVFDLCWLDAHKTFLEEYSGSAQAGGKFEALLMALGLITAAQERRNLGLQTYILKADLLQGFDLLWA